MTSRKVEGPKTRVVRDDEKCYAGIKTVIEKEEEL